MRTVEQNAKRYFTALWSIYVMMMIGFIAMIIIADDRIPDVAAIIAIVMTSVAAGGIAFLHGITLIVARQRDAAPKQKSV